MIYYVEAKPSVITDKYLDKVVSFSYEYLGLIYDLIIDFNDDLGGTAGYVDIEDEEITVYINPDQSIPEITRTIFHELVHAKQMLEGRFEEAHDKNPPVWEGEHYYGESYSEYPWEIEAYSIEEQMAIKFYGELN